ncbi:MAG: HD domain-containing protein [Acidimicrobiales bacterium]
MSPVHTVVDEFRDLLEGRGKEPYGEQVTIAEHSLLTALAATESGATDALVAACLLHDVGHWLDEPDDQYGIHSHDELGGDWVAERFGPEISEPVRLHVAAKRYLCGVDPAYFDHLSPASVFTLTKQGGPMSAVAIVEFEDNPHHDDAITLRKLEDDYGKRAGVDVPPLSRFAPLLLALTTTAGSG